MHLLSYLTIKCLAEKRPLKISLPGPNFEVTPLHNTYYTIISTVLEFIFYLVILHYYVIIMLANKPMMNATVIHINS